MQSALIVYVDAVYLLIDCASRFLLSFLLQKQGEEQVSSRPVTAFPIAGVIVHLSCFFPDLLHLFVAHCLSSCPILVPMYFDKNQNTKELEWHQLVKEIVDNSRTFV